MFGKETMDGQADITPTPLGNAVYKMKYKERQLTLVELILRHQIFYEIFQIIIDAGKSPNKEWIIKKVELNVCSKELYRRRSSSVRELDELDFNMNQTIIKRVEPKIIHWFHRRSKKGRLLAIGTKKSMPTSIAHPLFSL